MSERIKAIFEDLWQGIGSTMDIYPPETPSVDVKDPEERLLRPWLRTGQAIQRAIDQFESNQHS